ncbi:hypothetical protein OEB99_06285 [Actinotalea sp. M2MS4P-6]|uniref:hypothetical protein n=1 Tax=Actinotalea sp. M2MS4P-6 TaxID=2983762 RepID=UPI0021E36C1F|nr:hypothetical protein [Actinotalea sp. M2MS4P-6]MCV2393908.1 hypothetical protein [Actinotalea sp. M2MS4P-6]
MAMSIGAALGSRSRAMRAHQQPGTHRALFGHPAAGPQLAALSGTIEGGDLTVDIPTFDSWAVIVVDR